jgi:SAM-dependent methyltransferase
MDQAEFDVEEEKYSHLWAHGYKPARWKLLAGKLLAAAEAEPERPSILDFGSGLGNAVEYFAGKGYRAAGVDISKVAADRLKARGHACYWASLDSLAEIPDNAFDYGFSNDVLEHIAEKHLDGVFAEMRRVCARRLFLSVCPVPSVNRSREGENLHLTVRPKAWWEAKLARLGEVRELRFFLNRSLRYEVRLAK